MRNLKSISVAELREYFLANYGYIDLELNNKQIYDLLKRWNFRGYNIKTCASLLADHLLANGAYAQE